MTKELEALKRLSVVASLYCDECATSEEDLSRGMLEKDYRAINIIEKSLKALEILKNKSFVDFQMIKYYDNVDELNNYIKFMYGYKSESILTQEEFDLLKEVLC